MRSRPKLSVLIPTYNRRQLLPRCLDSVRLTTVDCEIIVCDDDSTDSTADYLQECNRQDARITLLRNEPNRGTVATVKRLFEHFNGQYGHILSDDDFVHPGNYEKKIALFDAYPQIGLVYSRWNTIDEEGRVHYPGASTNYSYIGGRSEFFELLVRFQGFHVNSNALMFRRELWEGRGGFFDENLEAGIDWDMWLRYTYGTETAFINEYLVTCQIHKESFTNTVGIAQGYFARGYLAVWRKWLVDRDPPIVLGDALWQRMFDEFRSGLSQYRVPEEQVPGYLEQFHLMRREYLAKLDCWFGVQTRWLKTRAWDSSGVSDARKLTDGAPSSSLNNRNQPFIVWSAPFHDPDTPGEEARSIARALNEAALTCRIEPVHWTERRAILPDGDRLLLDRLGWTAAPEDGAYVAILDLPADLLIPDKRAKRLIARTAFQALGIPPSHLERLSQFDAVWIQGEASWVNLVEAGISADKLQVLPPAVEVEQYGAALAPIPLSTGRDFNFLAVVDWTLWSGWDILVEAWAGAFQPDDSVGLILLVRSADKDMIERAAAEIRQLLNRLGQNGVAPISLQPISSNDSALPQLYRSVQACVDCSRGMGYGRTFLEGMASGRPVIAPRWGDRLDLLNESNGYLIDCEAEDLPAAIRAQNGGMKWGCPSASHLVSLLRDLIKAPDATAETGRRAASDTAAKASTRRIGQLIGQMVEQ